VEECLFNADDRREIGCPTSVRHRTSNMLVPDNNGPTGHAKRFASTRNNEDQADAWMLQYVVEGIDAAVAAPIRNGKGKIVKALNESRAISLWRQINEARRID
jgi:hypothetical protein